MKRTALEPSRHHPHRPMDILAVSEDRTRLLVIELKGGRASDAVVGTSGAARGLSSRCCSNQGRLTGQSLVLSTGPCRPVRQGPQGSVVPPRLARSLHVFRCRGTNRQKTKDGLTWLDFESD